MPFRSITPLCKSPSGSPGWTNSLQILLSLVALWKDQSRLWVRNIQPSPKVAAFCSDRSDTVHNLSPAGNCLNPETARSIKMAVALLPPLVSSSPGWQLFLREGQDVSHMSSAAWVEALSGMIYFHHTFHLPKRQQGQEAQASPRWFFISAPALPSVSTPVLGVAQSSSCCWEGLEPTPAHRFPHFFQDTSCGRWCYWYILAPSVNSVFAMCQTQSSHKPVTGFALILCALDWAHCGLFQDNNSQFLIRKVEIQQTKCRASLYAAKSGKMNWSLGSNCGSETGNSKSPTATNNVLWKNKYIPVERGMRNPHCIQRFGTNLFESSSGNQEICSNTFLLLSLRLNTYILARTSHWILFQHRKNSQGLGILCVVQNSGIMSTW